MAIRVIVFDFDGTLVDSNRIKAEAYFRLFPADDRHARIIQEVLAEIFEQSRYAIFEQILRRLEITEKELRDNVNTLAERYDAIVVAGTKTCPEKAGAEAALKKLAPAYALYVSSTTPEVSLKEIIRFRGWDGYFRSVFGYPHRKAETLRYVMSLENVKRQQVLVVGDGESDRASAMENGCTFVQVTEGFHFEDLEQMLRDCGRVDTVIGA